MLCATAIGVITWDAAAAALRWRWRRRNHGLPVGSLLEAFGFAENALSGRSRYRETDGGIWRSAAVLPLTALVYTASQQDDEQALPWLTRTVELLSTGDHDAAWRESTVAVSRVDDELGRWWVSAVWAMDARQRASVAAAMREAILPYAGVNR